jgi:hypothetical protein
MSKLLVMTGGPGVGKTTIVKAILSISRGEEYSPSPVRADGPRCQADDGGDRLRGQDYPPAARGRS